MNLAPHEIYAIEKHLLEQDLISLEFYDEMLDHFISSILDYKSKGNDFETAFILTKSAFKTVNYPIWGGVIKYKGLKALEMKHYEEVNKKFKNAINWSPLNLYKKKEGIPWIMAFLLYLFYAFNFGGEGLFLIVSVVLLLLFSRFFYYGYKAKIVNPHLSFGRWYRFMFSSLAKRKKVQLKPNYQLYILLKRIQKGLVGTGAFIFLGIKNMTQMPESLGLNIYTGQLVMAFLFLLMVADYWIQFKNEYDKTKLNKA